MINKLMGWRILELHDLDIYFTSVGKCLNTYVFLGKFLLIPFGATRKKLLSGKELYNSKLILSPCLICICSILVYTNTDAI